MPVQFGRRFPELDAILRRHAPDAVVEEQWSWRGSPLRLRISSYVSPAAVPEPLVISVRCVVAVRDCFVVCRTPLDLHIWPGGRREAHESYARTAGREVHEETGWIINDDAVIQLGFLHFEHLVPPPSEYPYPSPDFLQLVFGARVTEPDANPPVGWRDAEGWEVKSHLVKADHIPGLPLSATQLPFIRAFLDSALGVQT